MIVLRGAPVTAAWLLFLCLLLLPEAAFGHGVEVYDVTDSFGSAGAVRTVRFMYSTGEPMMYAAVRLFPPSRPETEILRGAADRNGSFSFAPDEAGEWRVTVEDGMGHKGAIVVYVDEAGIGGSAGEAAADKAARGGSAGGGGAPLFMRVLLGVSLILNIFAAYAFVLSRVTGRVKGCGQKKEGARAHQ